MTDWQPIETAPRDGTLILLWDPEGDPPYFPARFMRDDRPPRSPHGAFVWCQGSPAFGDRLAENVPTHWMPLPAPPGGQAMTDPAITNGGPNDH